MEGPWGPFPHFVSLSTIVEDEMTTALPGRTYACISPVRLPPAPARNFFLRLSVIGGD